MRALCFMGNQIQPNRQSSIVKDKFLKFIDVENKIT